MYACQAAVLSACHPHRHLCNDGGLSSLPAITHCLTHGGKKILFLSQANGRTGQPLSSKANNTNEPYDQRLPTPASI